MSRQDDVSADHISWLVESRSKNQQLSLKLYLVMKDNADKLSSRHEESDITQALVAVVFSLWRAVFLSDVSEEFAVISDAQSFLGNLILHNTVAYVQDRNTRDWTFIYYVNSARYRLKSIAEDRPDILPKEFVPGISTTNAKEYWTYYQNAAEVAVRRLEAELRK